MKCRKMILKNFDHDFIQCFSILPTISRNSSSKNAIYCLQTKRVNDPKMLAIQQVSEVTDLGFDPKKCQKRQEIVVNKGQLAPNSVFFLSALDHSTEV